MRGDILLLAAASAAEVARLIRMREVSAVDVTEACLARIEVFDATYRSYVTILKEQALEEATRADEVARKGKTLGLLHGVPVNVKDAFLMRGTPTTVGSVLLRDYAPEGLQDATCVRRLREAGAIMLGKTNVGGVSPAHFGNTRFLPPLNPWALDRTPGGSSSGSAVSLALGMAYASVGTDLGGSIRIPSALTGVVGFKPTYGRISRYGDVFGMFRALEHVGPITRTVQDAALMMNVLAGHDPFDPTSTEAKVPDYVASLDTLDDRRLQIAWGHGGGPMGAEAEVLTRAEAGVRLLAEAGVAVEEVDLPAIREDLWYAITLLDEWEAYDAHMSETRPYLAYVNERLRLSRQRVQAYLSQEIALIRQAYGDLLERYDLVALPTVPITAKPFNVRSIPWGKEERNVVDLHLVNTWMFNVTGHPAISLPCGLTSEGLPVGLELVGRHFMEEALLRTAALFEDAIGGFPRPQLPPPPRAGVPGRQYWGE
jgi:Asp-tRNA(Asn)/Glu-tRNA(Gln) amidotransferase A subunit family amidase